VRQWPWRRAFQLLSFRREFAAVARAGNHIRLGLPLGDAAEVGADGRDGVKTFRHAHDIDLLVLKEGNGMHWIKIGITGTKSR